MSSAHVSPSELRNLIDQDPRVRDVSVHVARLRADSRAREAAA